VTLPTPLLEPVAELTVYVATPGQNHWGDFVADTEFFPPGRTMGRIERKAGTSIPSCSASD